MRIGDAITRARQARRHPVRAALRAGIALAALAGGLTACGWATMVRMPGTSYAGPLEPLTDHARDVEAGLRRDVEALAGAIGHRGVHAPAGLAAAADLIDHALSASGYTVRRQRYEVDGQASDNLEVELPGARAHGIVVVGAHYDAVRGTVGADDNASGVAALLALARAFAHQQPARTLRFVAFANEEPPWFQTSRMGSVVYAKRCRERGEDVTAMLSLETIGYYRDAPGSQKYPFPFGLLYPTTGDFVAFVGDTSSAALVRRSVAAFRRSARFPSEGVAAPAGVSGIGWSDQWAFWQVGYPGVMVTDTAPFRNPNYHEATDTPETLAYGAMARVVVGLEGVVRALVGAADEK